MAEKKEEGRWMEWGGGAILRAPPLKVVGSATNFFKDKTKTVFEL